MSVTAHFIVTREADKYALTDSFTDSGLWERRERRWRVPQRQSEWAGALMAPTVV